MCRSQECSTSSVARTLLLFRITPAHKFACPYGRQAVRWSRHVHGMREASTRVMLQAKSQGWHLKLVHGWRPEQNCTDSMWHVGILNDALCPSSIRLFTISRGTSFDLHQLSGGIKHTFRVFELYLRERFHTRLLSLNSFRQYWELHLVQTGIT